MERARMLEPIISCLKEAKTVAISTHTRPDGDAIGSQLALGRFLEKQGASVRLINQDPTPYSLDWLPGIDRIERFDGSVAQREWIAGADAVVVVDTNTEDRLGDVGSSFVGASGKRLLIDHHTGPENWFDLKAVDEHISSTGELIYGLVAGWDVQSIDQEIAAALYVAVMTDTGSFRFSNVTGDVHRMIADLMDRGGLDVARIYSDVYNRRSREGLMLLSRVLATLELHHGDRVGSMVISRRMLSETGAHIEEADGFVNQILSVEGVRVALLFTETERGTKVSFRSRGNAHVHVWAQALGGGGHRNASGAFLRKDLDETMQLVIERAPKFIDLDTSSDSEERELDEQDAKYLNSLLNMQPRGSVG